MKMCFTWIAYLLCCCCDERIPPQVSTAVDVNVVMVSTELHDNAVTDKEAVVGSVIDLHGLDDGNSGNQSQNEEQKIAQWVDETIRYIYFRGKHEVVYKQERLSNEDMKSCFEQLIVSPKEPAGDIRGRE